MKNKIGDLNDHLFAELERLGDEEMTAEMMSQEVNRAKAISDVAARIIDSAKLSLEATKLQVEYGGAGRTKIALPEVLEDKNAKRNV